jgi:DMSO/TMAO reductase YedYZ molybdopterin-dependent catalytic subunit
VIDSPHPGSAGATPPPRLADLAGVAAAGFALGTTELVAGALPGAVSLVSAVGDAAVDWLPTPVIRFGIEAFGTDDKTVLVAVIIVFCGVLGAAFARAAARVPMLPVLGFALFGALGALAALRDPQASAVPVAVCALLGVAAGLGALTGLLRLAARSASRGLPARPVANGETTSPVRSASPIGVPDRRAFLVAAGAVAGAAVVFAAVGRSLSRAAASASRLRYSLPGVARPVPPPPPGAAVAVADMTPVVVPNDSFYRIDTRLLGPPRVDVEAWRLRVSGMVERPYELSFSELLELPMVEEYVTLCCVSNPVGGDLVGTAAWRGVTLASLLERAGVKRGATQIVGRSVDGFTVGFPTEVGLDGRHALVAVGMNGELLPYDHGFPARLVVAGLYGYTSATKWLEEIHLTTWDAFDAYWIPRGWSKYAPIKTQARIDRILPDPPVGAGPVMVAGVAWAPTRGISRVELQVDDEEWRDAELAEPLSASTWRQWRFSWQATPGTHRLRVRATDGHGETQTADASPPEPDGATGYHTVRVQVHQPSPNR